MEREIERKFLFDPKLWSAKALRSDKLEQGYLADTGGWEVRLRRTADDWRYTMKTGSGLDRGEWEVALSEKDFAALWPKTEGLRIEKVRTRYEWKGRIVEVDRYSGFLEGLTVAEVEFPSLEESRAFVLPKAFGPELTYDPRFKNRYLAGGNLSLPRQFPGNQAPGWAFGALPYRKGRKGWEIIIISTRRQDRWIFPKGQPELDMTPDKVALLEAKEEAGVSGRVTGHPIVLPFVRDMGTLNLLLFPVQVTDLADKYLELGQRERKIVPLAEADLWGDFVKLGAKWLRNYLGVEK